MLPSWMRSSSDMPRPMYFLATLTTRRRLASVRRFSALCPSSLSWSKWERKTAPRVLPALSCLSQRRRQELVFAAYDLVGQPATSSGVEDVGDDGQADQRLLGLPRLQTAGSAPPPPPAPGPARRRLPRGRWGRRCAAEREPCPGPAAWRRRSVTAPGCRGARSRRLRRISTPGAERPCSSEPALLDALDVLALLHLAGEALLVIGGEQVHLADLAQVHADGVVDPFLLFEEDSVLPLLDLQLSSHLRPRDGDSMGWSGGWISSLSVSITDNPLSDSLV